MTKTKSGLLAGLCLLIAVVGTYFWRQQDIKLNDSMFDKEVRLAIKRTSDPCSDMLFDLVVPPKHETTRKPVVVFAGEVFDDMEETMIAAKDSNGNTMFLFSPFNNQPTYGKHMLVFNPSKFFDRSGCSSKPQNQSNEPH